MDLQVIMKSNWHLHETIYSGKTTLLANYTNLFRPESDVPLTFDNYAVSLIHDGGWPVDLGLWNTAGGDEYDKLRPLSYSHSVRVRNICS